jgi:hypothetical protein
MKRRISLLFFIGIFLVGSTALGYYYYYVYSPPLEAAERFMTAMESGNAEALRSEVIVSTEDEGSQLREATDAEIQALLAKRFQRGRILDQRRREGNTRDYYYLVYREPDGAIYALVATEMDGRFRVVIPVKPMSKRSQYLWDYAWTN